MSDDTAIYFVCCDHLLITRQTDLGTANVRSEFILSSYLSAIICELDPDSTPCHTQ